MYLHILLAYTGNSPVALKIPEVDVIGVQVDRTICRSQCDTRYDHLLCAYDESDLGNFLEGLYILLPEGHLGRTL